MELSICSLMRDKRDCEMTGQWSRATKLCAEIRAALLSIKSSSLSGFSQEIFLESIASPLEYAISSTSSDLLRQQLKNTHAFLSAHSDPRLDITMAAVVCAVFSMDSGHLDLAEEFEALVAPAFPDSDKIHTWNPKKIRNPAKRAYYYMYKRLQAHKKGCGILCHHYDESEEQDTVMIIRKNDVVVFTGAGTRFALVVDEPLESGAELEFLHSTRSVFDGERITIGAASARFSVLPHTDNMAKVEFTRTGESGVYTTDILFNMETSGIAPLL